MTFYKHSIKTKWFGAVLISSSFFVEKSNKSKELENGPDSAQPIKQSEQSTLKNKRKKNKWNRKLYEKVMKHEIAMKV